MAQAPQRTSDHVFRALLWPIRRTSSPPPLAVGDCLCYDTHGFAKGLYRPSLDALWAPARARSSGFHSNPTIVRLPDGAGAA